MHTINKDENLLTRRVIGYVSRFWRDMVSGDDAISTVFKAGVIFSLGAGFVTGWAIPIVVAGAVGAVIYGIVGQMDEYYRNQEEDRKLARLHLLEHEIEYLITQAEHHKAFHLTFFEEEDHANISTLNNLNNVALLKLTLLNYLKKLSLLEGDHEAFEETLNSKRKKISSLSEDDTLPGQEGMISLIESVTGYSRKDKHFATLVERKLRETGLKVNENFFPRLTQALKLDKLNNNNTGVVVNLYPPKQEKTLLDKCLRVVKNLIFGTARGATAIGIVLFAGIMLGVIAPGVAASWPFIVGGVLIFVATAAAALIYARYIDKDYRTNCQNIDECLAYNKDRYKLLRKLHRLQTKKYGDHKRPQNDIWHKDDIYSQFRSEKTAPPVPMSTSIRHTAHSIAQFAYGTTAGIVLGMGVAAVICILLGITLNPIVVAITIPGIIVGAVIGFRFGHWLGKKAMKAGEAEKQQLILTADQVEISKKRFGEEHVEKQLKRSQHELVIELMTAYVNYAQGVHSNCSGKTELLSKQEAIIRLIEETSGVFREHDTGTHASINNVEFFGQLSLYLQSNPVTEAEANTTVTKFKGAVLGKFNEPVGNYQVKVEPDLVPTWDKVMAGVRSVIRFVVKHPWTFLGALSVALPFAFMPFSPIGPIAAIAIMIGFVMVAHGVHKFCEYHATQNAEKMADTRAKLNLIDAIAKTNKNTHTHAAEAKSNGFHREPSQTEPNWEHPVGQITVPVDASCRLNTISTRGNHTSLDLNGEEITETLH